MKRLASFKTLTKKISNSTEFLMDLIKMTPYKRGYIQYYSNNKWKGRWLNITRDCIIIEYPDVCIFILFYFLFLFFIFYFDNFLFLLLFFC